MRAKVVSRMMAVIGSFVFFVSVAQAGSAGGQTPPGLPHGTVASTCRLVDGEDVQAGVTLTDAYGTRQALIRSGRLLCTSVILKTALPNQLAIVDFPSTTTTNALRCYTLTPISGGGTTFSPNASPDNIKLFDRLHYVVDPNTNIATFTEQDVQVSSLQLLCVPAIAQPTAP